MSELNTENTVTVETETEDSTKKVPSNIYQVFKNEDLVTQQINEKLNVFKAGKLLSTIKEKIKVVTKMIKEKFSVDMIQKITGINKEEIEKIAQNKTKKY